MADTCVVSVISVYHENFKNPYRHRAVDVVYCTGLELLNLFVEECGAMQFYGVLLGLISFLVIGLFHPVVIKCEYHFSYKVWPVFLFAGAALLIASLFTANTFVSAVLGVVGVTFLWSIIELFHQRRRVEKGWFPANPKHHAGSNEVDETKIFKNS